MRAGAARAVLAEAADVTHDRAAIDRAKPIVGKAKPGERAGAEVLDDHIASLDEALQHAFSIRVLEIDGAETTFTLTGEKPNSPAPDSEFVFQAPKGIPVVEGMPPV